MALIYQSSIFSVVHICLKCIFLTLSLIFIYKEKTKFLLSEPGKKLKKIENISKTKRLPCKMIISSQL